MDIDGHGKIRNTIESQNFINHGGQGPVDTRVYFEPIADEAKYSYAREIDVSNGTVSTYVEGCVGYSENHIGVNGIDRDEQTENNTGARPEDLITLAVADASNRPEDLNRNSGTNTSKRSLDLNAHTEQHKETRTIKCNANNENQTRPRAADSRAQTEHKTSSRTVDLYESENHKRTRTVNCNALPVYNNRTRQFDRNAHTEKHNKDRNTEKHVRARTKIDRNVPCKINTNTKTAAHNAREANDINIDTNNSVVSYHALNGRQQGTIEQHNVLSESSRSTGTTYDKIVDSDIDLLKVNQHKTTQNISKSDGLCSPCRCAIATIFVLLVILITAGVLTYIFVIDKQFISTSCEQLPMVKDGEIKREPSNRAKITCNKGFELNGNSTVTCLNDIWSEYPTCEPVDCGTYPQIDNGVVNRSGTTFQSKIHIICNPGFHMVDGVTTATCLEDGNWSSLSECREHPCGIYRVSDEMVAKDEILYTTMTLCLQCKAGLNFVNNSDSCVRCQNRIWQGNPECEITGTVNFDPVQPVYNVSDPLVIKCVIQNSSEWKSIILARSDFQGDYIEPLIELTSKSGGDIKVNKFSEVSNFTAAYELFDDGVAIIYEVEKVRCNDSGVYICGNVLGDYTSPIKVKSANISIDISDTGSSVPEIFLPEVMYENIETVITCTGELGKGDNDTAIGKLALQIRYKGTTSFNILPSMKNYTLIENCKIKKSIISSVVPNMAMREAYLQCVVIIHDEIETFSPEVQVNVESPIVTISALLFAFNIGEYASISCTLNYVTGWDLIEVRKICNDNSEVIARINRDSSDQPLLGDGHVRMTQIDIQTGSANFVLVFEPVYCKDACGYTGEVEYVVAVWINKVMWIQNSTQILFQRQPEIPTLENFYDGMSGKMARFRCTGEVGDPKGYLEIESNFENSNFTVFLSNKDGGSDKNEFGLITNVKEDSGQCSTKMTIDFLINNATAKFHNKLLKCISKPAKSLTNGRPAESIAESIEVIPEDHCSQHGVSTGALRHPFHCNKFVLCQDGQVSGVPAGCAEGKCFNVTCYPCEQMGGCSVTDIYIENFVDSIQIGDSVTLVCKVKDFHGLTDIVIYKDNSTLISSVINGDTNFGFDTVTEYSHITGRSGQLMLYLASAQCQNSGTYRCVPVGVGKHSADETTLLFKDADGNIVC